MQRARENRTGSIMTANQIAAAAGTIAMLLATNIWAGPVTDASQLSAPIPTDLLLSLIDSESTAADPAVTQIGPVPSSSPDSGTCGGDPWAEDQFTRYFTIKTTGQPGTFRIFEKFKDGTFVTVEALSPGACDETDGTPPAIVHSGVHGNMHGYLITDVTCDPGAVCPVEGATCGTAGEACQTTDQFIQTFFGAATRSDVAFFFHYSGLDGANRALVFNEWKNASTNRGGNHGDIASCLVGQLSC
jgi:hypothetical protein